MANGGAAIPDPAMVLAWLWACERGGRPARQAVHAWLADPVGTPPVPAAPPELVTQALANAASRGWRWVPCFDPTFPQGLLALADPPIGVFLRGRWQEGPAVALVGSRHASAYGREVAEYLGSELARAGVWVVSGMARGVDGAAHRGALAGGRTAAVWGAGPDCVYPREHEGLAEAIAERGCLLTEYPPGSPPLPRHFPERNRLIVGLVSVVVVVEATERSGALITARLALDEGREVMAVPGSVFSRLSTGPNGLIRAGAAPVLGASDILDILGLPKPPPAAAPPPDDPIELAIPAGRSMTADAIAAATGKPMAEVLEALLRLELAGRLVREADGSYRRCRANPPGH